MSGGLEGETSMTCCQSIVGGVSCDLDNCNNCLIYKLTKDGIQNIKEKFEKVTIFDHYDSIRIEKENKK